MSIKNQRNKTLNSFSQIRRTSFSSQRKGSCKTQLPKAFRTVFLKMQNKGFGLNSKAENESRASHSKLLSAKARKLQLQKSQEQERKKLQQQLLAKQQKSQKNLAKLRASQLGSFDINKRKLEQVRQKIKTREKDELATTLTKFNQTQQQMVSFYNIKAQRKQDHNEYIQVLHRDITTVLSNPDRVNPKKLSLDRSFNDTLKKDLEDKLNPIVSPIKSTTRKSILSKIEIAKKLESQRQAKILNSFVEKMQEINNIRNKRAAKLLKSPVKSVFEGLPHLTQKMKNIKNPQQSPYSKNSSIPRQYRFSEKYDRQLEKKKQFIELSFQKRLSQGQQFMKVQSDISHRNKINKILSQSKNQVKRRMHNALMQQIHKVK